MVERSQQSSALGYQTPDEHEAPPPELAVTVGQIGSLRALPNRSRWTNESRGFPFGDLHP